MWWILDRVVVTVALAGCFIRLGNFFNSEIIGKATDLPWAVIFKRVDMIPRHPSQIYESIAYLFIFFFLYNSYWKRNKGEQEGYLFGMFLILVFGFRFIVEFSKEVQVAFENTLPLNMGQLLSIPLVLTGVFFVMRSQKKNG
jgi:prolipoprotein diacylglyceryltransferase